MVSFNNSEVTVKSVFSYIQGQLNSSNTSGFRTDQPKTHLLPKLAGTNFMSEFIIWSAVAQLLCLVRTKKYRLRI